jgi:hypothetical protein
MASLLIWQFGEQLGICLRLQHDFICAQQYRPFIRKSAQDRMILVANNLGLESLRRFDAVVVGETGDRQRFLYRRAGPAPAPIDTLERQIV